MPDTPQDWRRERPEFPEEARPGGHDAEPQPADVPPEPLVGAGRNGGVGITPGAQQATRDEAAGPAADAQFLTETFDIPAPRAAKLVHDAEPGDANAVPPPEPDDPLQGHPVPQASAGQFTVDADEERLKPVLHTPNNRTGGG